MRLPGSKSLTNRNLIIAALTSGTTTLHGILYSDDTHYLMEALRTLGYELHDDGNGTITIHGGIEQMHNTECTLYVGASGTSLRFLLSLVCLKSKGITTLTGDNRLCQRPIHDLVDALSQLISPYGASISTTDSYAPLTIDTGNGGRYTQLQHTPTPPHITINGESSSQFITSLLHIAPLLPHGLTITINGTLVSTPYIDLTINEMRKHGVHVAHTDYTRFEITHQEYTPGSYIIEGDASALSYPAAHIALYGGDLTINNIDNTTSQGDYQFLTLLAPHGLTTTVDKKQTTLSAPGIITILPSDISHQRKTIDFVSYPDVSLTYMIIAPFLSHPTHLTGLQTLNLKECRRIDAMATELRKLDVSLTYDETSMTIHPAPHFIDQTRINNQNTISIETYNDHRIAMCFGVLTKQFPFLQILNPGCVSKTYPRFWDDLPTR